MAVVIVTEVVVKQPGILKGLNGQLSLEAMHTKRKKKHLRWTASIDNSLPPPAPPAVLQHLHARPGSCSLEPTAQHVNLLGIRLRCKGNVLQRQHTHEGHKQRRQRASEMSSRNTTGKAVRDWGQCGLSYVSVRTATAFAKAAAQLVHPVQSGQNTVQSGHHTGLLRLIRSLLTALKPASPSPP